MDSALLNAAVSPNGERVAWVENTDLWVAAIDGSGKRKLRGGVDNTCWTPAWSPDSRELAVGLVTPDNPGVYQAATIDLSTGTVREAGRTEGCHPVWSGDGTLIAYADGTDGGINMAAPDGANRRSVPGLGGKARYSTFDLASLSPDGHQIALYRRGPGMESGDVARELTVNVVLDTRTGAEIKLPLEDRDLLQAYFQSDGTLVARVKSGDHNLLVLIGEDGQKISETRELAELRNMQILAVTR
ncbi:MAG TPA: hypothetical protein VHN18_11700 [Micromonosporaceae bacterium]|nr:hypothetical protein [Micromonosporaceae bacterium]